MTLKSFSLDDNDYSNNLIKNVISWLNDGFYSNGEYTNTSGLLSRVDHPEYLDGQVWGSNKKNWCWENSVVVKVNNVVNTANTVDYINGLIIFSGVVNTSVYAEYSFRNVYIVDGNDINYKGSYGKFDVYDGTYRENALQLPAIVIESGRSTSTPLELGGYSRIVAKQLLLNVLHRNSNTVDRISNILYNQVDTNVSMYDFDAAYASGVYPVDFDGTLLNSNGNYNYLCDNYPYDKARNSYFYIDSTEDEGSQRLPNNLYHNTIRYNTVAELNMGYLNI